MGPIATIDLAALQHNLQRAKAYAPQSKVIAVIKANAYGHGIVPVARALDQADTIGVARVEEGVLLRQAGITKKILVLEGFFNQFELDAVFAHNLDVAIHQPEQLELLRNVKGDKTLNCWLKLDTGMHRLGFPLDRFEDALKQLKQITVVSEKLRVMTHFASADDPSDASTAQQLDRFNAAVASLNIEKSTSNSAGVLAWPDAHCDWVRPGIMLYGASPMMKRHAVVYDLRPVMTLSSRLIAINHYAAGEPIGYGGSWRCPESMAVGTVAIGYGDGYPRHAPSGTPVLLNGSRVPLVGRVSMDMINIDLRTQPDAQLNDPVILWGKGLPAEEIAEQSETIAYELFCGVTQRVNFEYVTDGIS